MATTIEELAAKVAELEQQMAAITAPPTEYYTSAYSGEEIDAAVKKVSEGLAGGVTSFNGRTGAVLPQSGDYNATQIPVSGEPEAETVAAALSNKAPGGFGLGTHGPFVIDLNEAVESGFYTVAGTYQNGPADTGAGFSLLLVLSGSEGNRIAQIYYGNNTSFMGCIATRYYNNGKQAWSPWEWINPPMQLGVEYRTAERYNGKLVYAKAINFGQAPNATYKDVSHGIENFGQLVSYTGMMGGSNLIETPALDSIQIDASNIRITTNSDVSASYVYLVLRYTKTTD